MQSELQSVLSHEDLMDAVVLIFANKQDLKDALTVEELTQKLQLHNIKSHDWHIQSCCAVSGEVSFYVFQNAKSSGLNMCTCKRSFSLVPLCMPG